MKPRDRDLIRKYRGVPLTAEQPDETPNPASAEGAAEAVCRNLAAQSPGRCVRAVGRGLEDLSRQDRISSVVRLGEIVAERDADLLNDIIREMMLSLAAEGAAA